MDLPRHIVRILTAVTACVLVSCIDGHEEIWLNPNGSGRADVCYSLPAAAARFQGGEAGVRRIIGDFLQATPAITTSSYEVVTDHDQLKIRVLATFDSALGLQQISKSASRDKLPSSASHLAGEINVDVDGRTVDFARTIAPGMALPGAIFLPVSQFEGRNLTYIIHLPAAATETNATRIDDGGRTLTWEYPLAGTIRSPVTLRFKAKIPIPSWVLASAGAATLAAGVLGFLAIRRTRRVKPPQRG